MRLLERVRRAFEGGSGRGGQAAVAVVVELGRIAREMLMIPAQIWLALAEVAGGAVLAAWRVLWPLLLGAVALLRAGLAVAQRQVTPERALVAVAVVALVALAASQWVDYRAVSVGTEDYVGGVELVAPPPDIARDRAGEAHSWVMLPLALAGLTIVAVAALGRRQLARLLIGIGLAVIAIALLVDRPSGLDEGITATAYEGAKARLLEGFWVELASGAVIALCGLMLPPALGLARSTQSRRSPHRRPRRRVVQTAGTGVEGT